MKFCEKAIRKTVQKQSQSGAAMIMAVIVLMIISMLSTSLLMISYSLFSTSNKQYQLEQCREMAVTVSKELRHEIADVSFATYAEQQAAQKAIENGSDTSNKNKLWFYLRYNIFQTSWPYFADERGHSKTYAYRYFDLNATGDDDALSKWKQAVDDTTVLIYYKSESGAAHQDTELVVTVTCTKGDQSSSLTGTYELSEELYGDEGITADQQEEFQFDKLNPDKNKIDMIKKWKWSKPTFE